MDIQTQLERMKVLREKSAQVENIEDLERYMELLSNAWGDGVFEPQSVNEYLNGIWGVIEGMPERTEAGDPTPASWALFARILLRAFGHS